MSAITSAILIVAAVAVTGLVLGGLRIKGVGFGPAGVLFTGILFGHFGATVDPEISEFAKEFGLILFVFTVGLQLGPGIVQLWKQRGLLLNGLALAVILMGVGLIVVFRFVLGLSVQSAAGLFCGAVTNTPALGAAQQAAGMLAESETGTDALASAYAVAYPGAVVGIIVSMLLLKRIFRINVDQEAEQFRDSERAHRLPLERRTILVDNSHLNAVPFGEIPGVNETGVRVSRIRHQGEDAVSVATEATELSEGDIVQVIGTKPGLDRFEPLIGSTTNVDLMKTTSDVTSRRVHVTESDSLNKPLRDLSLDHFYNATVTRIIRSGVEMAATGSSRFYYGDVAHIVGDRESLDRLTTKLGNSTKSLNETQFSPLFLGIAIGVLIGMIPLNFPGVPFPVRLGMAGGPLVAAIVLSLCGNVGRFVWYIPYQANLALRELGIILFLTFAGLGAGRTFFHVALSIEGMQWMLAGLVVTTVPLMTAGIIARAVLKQNYLTICGVMAGSMTDPPALAFVNSMADSDASSTAYAAVYPMTMILRIVFAQAIVLLFA